MRISVASVSLMKLDYHIDTLLIQNFRSLELNLEFYENIVYTNMQQNCNNI